MKESLRLSILVLVVMAIFGCDAPGAPVDHSKDSPAQAAMRKDKKGD